MKSLNIYLDYQQLLLPLLILQFCSQINAQDSKNYNRFFYKIGVATTLKVNEDFGSKEDYDDDEPFLVPGAFFISNSLGFRFDRKLALEANLEFDWHSESGLLFAPAYLSIRHKMKADDALFLRVSYGSLLKIGKSFEKGSIFKAGIGQWVENNSPNTDRAILLGLEFTRKTFGWRENDSLLCFSIFVEFSFF